MTILSTYSRRIYCARSMRALSSQQPRFLNNLCVFVWESTKPMAPGFIPSIRHTSRGVPKRVPKITSTCRNKNRLPGPQKKTIFFWKSCAKNLLDNNGLLAPKAPYLKADFAEGEILRQQFPARELRTHLLRESSLVSDDSSHHTNHCGTPCVF